MKRLQNKIAESGLTLPVAAVYNLMVWLLAGLFELRLWPQLACHAATVYLLIELSTQNALLRIRSRMVSATFLMLSAAACFLFPSITGALVQLCFAAVFLLLFQCYQAPQAVGRAFYAFAAVGLASMASVQVLWYVPVLWVLMATQLQSLNGRTWAASLLGLATPYWFALLWLLMPFHGGKEPPASLAPLANHFSLLADVRFQLPVFPLSHYLAYALTLVLAVVGMAHFWSYSFEDKIRIRLLYGFFTAMTAASLLFILLQPQHYDVFMRIALISASPLIAHVGTFTSSKLSNILFFAALAAMVGVAMLHVLHV